MMKHQLIRLGVVATCVAVFAGCGKKDADEAEKKPEPTSKQEQKDIVQLSEESLPLAHIETVVVAPSSVNVPLRAPGRISFDLNHTAKITSTLEGRIQKMNYDVGALVKQDDVVAVIDSPESFKPLELKAPVEGRIVERQGTVGELLDKTKNLYTISDLNTVWCIAAVSENDIAAVRVGQPANLRVLAYPQETFAGKVALLSDAVDEKTRTIDVRIETDNQSAKLKAGMFADVEIVTSILNNVLVIPDEAIQRLEEQEIVFVAIDQRTFAKRVVKTGRAQNGKIEIDEGLKEGERVVGRGSFLLKSELLKGQFGE